MCLPAITGLLGNVSFGAVYYMVAPKFSFFSKIPLKIQMKAFGLAAVWQGIFTSCYPPKKNEGFSKRKFVVTPYLLISGSMYFSHRQALKANAVSTFVLGTAQLAIGQLAPKIVSYFTNAPQEIAFGKDDWARYFGDVGEVPPIPEGMAETLKALCPFNPGKQVGDTHMLMLIPQTVNGKPFTLNLLQELIGSPQGKDATSFAYYASSVKEALGDAQTARPYWILMTKNVIPGSRNKTYGEQKQFVQEKGADVYELPSAIEAAASILMHYFKTDECLYGQDPWTYTRCQETVTEDQWPVAIGGFSRGGLFVGDVSPFAFYCAYGGAAAVRKF